MRYSRAQVAWLTDRVITLRAGKEIDRCVKIVLSYETILELWAEELLRARAGVEVRFQPDERDWGHARLVFGGHLTFV